MGQSHTPLIVSCLEASQAHCEVVQECHLLTLEVRPSEGQRCCPTTSRSTSVDLSVFVLGGPQQDMVLPQDRIWLVTQK